MLPKTVLAKAALLRGPVPALVLMLCLSFTAVCGQNDSLSAKREGGAPPAGRLDHPEIYHLKKNVDYPVALAGAAWTLYGLSQVSNKNPSDENTVLNLKESNVPWFDRWAIKPYSKSADKASYMPFYVAIPLPLIAFGLDPKTRKDYSKLVFLYAEAMILTGALYSSATHYVDRYRPLVYRSESPMDTRLSGNSRNAFFAGHVALVGTSFFFVAKVFADYHPESHYKWAFYSGAAAVTALTGYLRHEAGEHFPSDIALGTVVGTLSGLLTPSLHKVKAINTQRLTILPLGATSQNPGMVRGSGSGQLSGAGSGMIGGSGSGLIGGSGLSKGLSVLYKL